MAAARAAWIRATMPPKALNGVCSLEDMVEALKRARLARSAAALNRASCNSLPPLVLMTDDERLPDPLAAARALPRGSMLIVRARQGSHRAKLVRALRPVARARGLLLLIANDPQLAKAVQADGVHFSEGCARQTHVWRARCPRWIVTAAAHSLRACALASRYGASAALLSPVFPTGSHPGAEGLGACRARFIAKQSGVPVYALGGIAPRSAGRLAGSAFIGIAAIGALAA